MPALVNLSSNNRAEFSKTWLAWAFALALWICHPTISANYLVLTQQLRWYPVNADSIGIPVAGACMLGVIGFPFWIAFCYQAFKNLPKSGHLFWPNLKLWRQHPFRSVLLGVLFLLCCLSVSNDLRLYRELAVPEYAHYAYFGICSIGSTVAWALFWLMVLNCAKPTFLSTKDLASETANLGD